jgi:hypothetical protein
MSLTDALDTELFWNKKIGRRLSLADAREMLEFMRKEGRAEWAGGKGERDVCWVWWRTPEEWAGVIADWVSGFVVCRELGGLEGRRLIFGSRLMKRGRRIRFSLCMS